MSNPNEIVHFESMITWLRWPKPSICGQERVKVSANRVDVSCNDCLEVLAKADKIAAAGFKAAE